MKPGVKRRNAVGKEQGMRLIGVTTGSRKRRPITRRDWKSDRRRGGQHRVWIGSRARRSAPRPLFFGLSAQHMRRSWPAEWLGAAAMLLAMLSWGALAALLGA
jgi:hypothetical protein